MGNLIVKSLLGLTFLIVVLALALFVSAGSVRFWQGWVYLVTFASCTLLITLYLMKYDQRLLASRVKAGPTAEIQKTQQIIQSLASLLFISVFIVPGLDYRFHWSNIAPMISLLSNGFVVVSFLIIFLVFRENTYTSALIEVAQEQKVIETGLYKVVRHPMYSGASLLLIFTPIALGSWVAIVPSVALIFVIVIRLLDEERFLSANLEGYDRYRQQVRHRLVPFIW